MRLGELLIQKSLISETQLTLSLARQFRTHEKLGECLILDGHIQESVMLKALSEQLQLQFSDEISHTLITQESIALIPKGVAKKLTVIAGLSGSAIVVFANDDLNAIGDFLADKGLSYAFILTKKSNIRKAVDEYYG